MNKTLTATFHSEEALKAAEDDLVNATIAGFPREKIFVDKAKMEIKVITPTVTEGEVRKVFEAHNPKAITERVWKE